MKLHKNREKSLCRLQLERNITAYSERAKYIYIFCESLDTENRGSNWRGYNSSLVLNRMWMRTWEWKRNLWEHAMKVSIILLKEGRENSKGEEKGFQESRLQQTQDTGRSHVMEEKFKGIKKLSTSWWKTCSLEFNDPNARKE